MTVERTPLGIYIHVPFCRVHCPYCDFYTYPASRGRGGDFVTALLREIELSPTRLNPETALIETVYFGGGTPSLLDVGQVARILEALRAQFVFAGDTEITFEVNPEDAVAEYPDDLRGVGVNRLSLGAQSLDPHVLARLGRVHTARQVEQSLRLLSDWPNWSADIIFGWIGQTVEDLRREILGLAAWGPPHVSLYQLTLEPRTRFGVLAGLGRMRTADPERQADLYLAAIDELHRHGLAQYEVSNFARPGFESRHNRGYWRGRAYLGLGPSASSMLWARRTENVRSLPRYIERLRKAHSPVASVEILDHDTERRERIWLGLRTREGVPREWLEPAASGLIEAAVQVGLIIDSGSGHIALSHRGMATADEVVTRLLLTIERPKR